jgi:hypothetical protein
MLSFWGTKHRKEIMQEFAGRRTSLRVPFSFTVRCLAGNDEIRGDALSLASGGLEITTSSPIATGEHLTVEFSLLGIFDSISVRGEVVWFQAHHDPGQQAESRFSQGIRFVSVDESIRTLIVDYIYKLFWKEYPATTEEFQQVLSEVKNFRAEE